jgi:hypothetical protein
MRTSPAVKGSIILTTALALFFSLAIWAWISREPPRDPKTHCLLDKEKEIGHTLIFVDKTDLWNEYQAQQLEDHILWVVGDKMQEEERLSIFVFGERFVPGFPPVFSVCKPPEGKGPERPDRSVEYFRRKYKTEFVEPLQEVLEDVKRATEGDCSPIAEVVANVVMRHPIRVHPGQTRIVMISDMAQNSALYSAFRYTKCFPINPQIDHTRDASAMIKFFQDRRGDMSLSQVGEVIIFQVIPEKNPKWMQALAKQKWNDVFRALNLKVEWQFL